MKEYESPKAEFIEFESRMILETSPGCTCQDITADQEIFVCPNGSLDNSYDTSEED